MEQQAQFQQYVQEVREWGKQLEESWLEEDANDIEMLLARLEEHEGEWLEEEIANIQMMVEAIYEKAVQAADRQLKQEEANEEQVQEEQEVEQNRVPVGDHPEQQAQFQQYVQEVREWGKQLEESWLEEDANDIEMLLARLEEHEGEWLEEEITNIQTMVEAIYEKAVQTADRQLKQEQEEIVEEQRQNRVPVGGHTLPPLPYRYDALEPHISEEIMRLHHTKHHKSYVDGLNQAEKMMQRARQTNDYSLLKHWEREAAFHGSGHYLHTIFWNNMTPNGGGRPQGALLEQIRTDFGSVEQFQQHFTEAAKSVEGVGWALLVWSPRANRLEILQTEKHQLMTQWDTIPLLVLDVWEHAYYLQYKNDRTAYIRSFWNVVNWRDVERRFEQASKQTSLEVFLTHSPRSLPPLSEV